MGPYFFSILGCCLAPSWRWFPAFPHYFYFIFRSVVICHPPWIISSSFCCFLLTIKNQGYGVRFSFTSLISSWYHFKAVCCMIIQQLPSYSSLSLGLRRTTSNSWGSWYEFGYHIIPNSCIIIAENYSLLPNLAHFEHSECRQHYWAQFQLGKPFKKTKFAFKIGISWFAA